MYTLNTMIKCASPTKTRDGRIFPCGQCINCRKSRMLEWNVRGMHHLMTEKKASFITLTYKSRYLPKADNGESTLRHRDFQLFMKRLRKFFGKKVKLSYIMCGEYGENGTKRPHMHAIIYGVDRNDWEEEDLKKIWKMGKVELSKLPFSRNAIEYVTGYVRKKLLDRRGKHEYLVKGKKPPYQITSKGIGKKWAINNYDLWSDSLSIATKYGDVSVPRYYIKTIKKIEGVTYKYNKVCSQRVPRHYYKGYFQWGTIEDRKDYILRDITYYKTIENIYGEKTQKINTQLWKKHCKKYDELENLCFKLNDTFGELGRLREEKEKFWEWYYNKVREYCLYYNKEWKFLKDMKNQTKEDYNDYLQGLAWRKVLVSKKLNPQIPAEVANFANTRKKREISGLYGKRNKVKEWD